MNRWPAYEEVVLEHGGNVVTLRPCLRAACHLERLHDGFPTLIDRLDGFHVGTVREVVLTAGTNRKEASAFLASFEGKPVYALFSAVHQPLSALIGMFFPAQEKPSKQTTGKLATWRTVYADLYSMATGFLRWSPDRAWNATPTEIDRAIAGYVAARSPINQSADDALDPHQAEQNLEDGLDPDFDRAGLRSLKQKLAGAR